METKRRVKTPGGTQQMFGRREVRPGRSNPYPVKTQISDFPIPITFIVYQAVYDILKMFWKLAFLFSRIQKDRPHGHIFHFERPNTSVNRKVISVSKHRFKKKTCVSFELSKQNLMSFKDFSCSSRFTTLKPGTLMPLKVRVETNCLVQLHEKYSRFSG